MGASEEHYCLIFAPASSKLKKMNYVKPGSDFASPQSPVPNFLSPQNLQHKGQDARTGKAEPMIGGVSIELIYGFKD